jgi:hypothetical protein
VIPELIIFVSRGITVLHILSVFVALLILHARRMRRIILSSVVCPSVPYVSTLSHTGQDFSTKKVIEQTMGVFYFLYNFCLKYFSFYEELAEI